MPMSSLVRTGLARLMQALPTVLTLAGLGLVAVYGSYNDWKAPNLFGASAAGDRQQEDDSALKVVKPASAAKGVEALRMTRIEFPSQEALDKIGLSANDAVVKADVKKVGQYVVANGMVDYDPGAYAHIAARASGTVYRVFKQIGQPVREHELLALIESAEVGKLKSDFLASLTQFQLRERLLLYMRDASKNGSFPESQLREAEAAMSQAGIRLFNDEQALLNLGLTVDRNALLKNTEEQRVQVVRFLGVPDEARSAVMAETRCANLLPVLAPFDGQLVQRNAARGEAVGPNRPLFVVADVRDVHIELAVDPRDVGRIKPKQRVSFQPEGQAEVSGVAVVAHIVPEVDEKTRKVWVHAEADNAAGKLLPHSFGTGRIVVVEPKDALVVPAEALQVISSEGKEGTFVFVKVGPLAFEARKVLPGVRDGNLVTLDVGEKDEVDQVKMGDEVVTVGSFVLKSTLLRDRIAGAD
jgi:cobalt-zinc-cadmium efflux system membrane fusion protein